MLQTRNYPAFQTIYMYVHLLNCSFWRLLTWNWLAIYKVQLRWIFPKVQSKLHLNGTCTLDRDKQSNFDAMLTTSGTIKPPFSSHVCVLYHLRWGSRVGSVAKSNGSGNGPKTRMLCGFESCLNPHCFQVFHSKKHIKPCYYYQKQTYYGPASPSIEIAEEDEIYKLQYHISMSFFESSIIKSLHPFSFASSASQLCQPMIISIYGFEHYFVADPIQCAIELHHCPQPFLGKTMKTCRLVKQSIFSIKNNRSQNNDAPLWQEPTKWNKNLGLMMLGLISCVDNAIQPIMPAATLDVPGENICWSWTNRNHRVRLQV
jgi:hypothetical protein